MIKQKVKIILNLGNLPEVPKPTILPQYAQKLSDLKARNGIPINPCFATAPTNTFVATAGSVWNKSFGMEPAEARGKCPMTVRAFNGKDVEVGIVGEYRANLEKALGTKKGFFSKFELNGGKLDANHRLPPKILTNEATSSQGLADLLVRLEIDNVNNPRLMELINKDFNQRTHVALWRAEIRGKSNMSADEILQAWKNVEQKMNYYDFEGKALKVIRPDNAVVIRQGANINNY